VELHVRFPGGKRFDATVGAHVLRTDQPASLGGDDSAPAPFDLFLASLATCAGIYVLGFCQARGIPTDGIELVQRSENAPDGRLASVALEVVLPPDFPAKYVPAVLRAAEGCKVKKTLAAPPEITIRAAERGASTVAA
jgi:ribosomal protein S12 methylthiotransferase accessory factor